LSYKDLNSLIFGGIWVVPFACVATTQDNITLYVHNFSFRDLHRRAVAGLMGLSKPIIGGEVND
jgi:hypothetical protein